MAKSEGERTVIGWSFRQDGPFDAPTSATLIATFDDGSSLIMQMDIGVARDLSRKLSLITMPGRTSG